MANAEYRAVYFSDSIDYVYKAKVSVYRKELTGIFIAKRINDSVHRVVFTTEFGNKLLDFELSDNVFKVNSIVSALDRKILINTLRTDLRLLLRTKFIINKQYENDTIEVYNTKSNDGDDYLFVSKTGKKLLEIAHGSKKKKKIVLTFIPNGNIADRVTIRHNTIKLKIALNYLGADKP